jgi:hypothetical protein
MATLTDEPAAISVAPATEGGILYCSTIRSIDAAAIWRGERLDHVLWYTPQN